MTTAPTTAGEACAAAGADLPPRRRAHAARTRRRPGLACWRTTASWPSMTRRSTGQTIDETVDRVRGPRGTTVQLSVVRGAAAAIRADHRRATSSRREVVTQRASSPTGRVGYLRLDGFSVVGRRRLPRPARAQLVDAGVQRHRPRPARRPGRLRGRAPSGSPASSSPTGPIYWEEYADGTEHRPRGHRRRRRHRPRDRGRRARQRRLGDRQRDRRRRARRTPVGRRSSARRRSARAPSSSGSC